MKRLLLLLLALSHVDAADELENRFATPPEGTRPRCYWYWMDGHITKEGLTHDLEAMRRVGIGEGYIGVISGQSGLPASGGPKSLTDEWWGFIEHAVREGGRLGVDIGLFNSPGWSQSGGPWVKSEQAMRYVVLPETRLRGPQRFEGKLSTPPGAFQDIAVLAFPAPAGEGEWAKETARTPKVITFEMPARCTARSVTVQPVKPINVMAELQASEDGQQYRTVKKFAIDRHNLGVSVGPVPLAPVVASFPATTARFFRLNFSAECEVGDIRLSPAARVESYAEKSLLKMFQDPLPPFDFYTWPASAEPEATDLRIAPEAVLDLSPRMAADGTLRWDVPAGEWVVLRAGMTPTGTQNSPAPPEATGLEVDKMNRVALKSHFDAYVGQLLQRLPPAERTALKHVIADSYETGPQNWTDGFAADFRERYGYDPLPWLPVFTGRIVGSADQSDRFLWDVRRMVADRVARDYVGGLRDLCRQHGLRMWLENYGHWGFPGEFLKYGGLCDEIGGEFWVSGELGHVEVRDAASAAHTYGMPVVWAEAFTGGPAFVNTPRDLKARGDWAFCEGANQFVLHVFIHQPWNDRRPGINAGWGTEFNRHNTWFDSMKPWVDYLRRCCAMLQAGKPVADVAYFIGEDAPKMAGTRKPELPAGYDFDYINADVIENRLAVTNGRFTLPDGMSYRVLVLPESATMRPAVLRRIRDLVAAGGAVLGAPPVRSPSRQNYPECDQRVRAVAEELWGAGTGSGEPEKRGIGRRVGQGVVFRGDTLQAVLDEMQVPPDLTGVDHGQILFLHRKSADADIYFLSNQNPNGQNLCPAFRVHNKAPELWHADTGRIERPAVYDVGEGQVRLPIHLDPAGSVFVVFREKAGAGRVVSVSRNGEVLLNTAAAKSLAGQAAAPSTFTVAMWVKPADHTPLFAEANRGVIGIQDHRNDAVPAQHGDTIAPGGGHAGCGLSVGTNGVCVFEHGANYFAPVLVYRGPVQDWTHVAVVYDAGQPSLYLDGVLVRRGLKSEHVVHPSAYDPASSGSFRGELGRFETFPHTLSQAEIDTLKQTMSLSGARPTGAGIELSRASEGRIAAQAWQAGSYEITMADGRSHSLAVPAVPAPVEVSGPWKVEFPSKHVRFEKLISWANHADPEIKYFSGTATYRAGFNVVETNAVTVLDLGMAHAIARVRVNGREVGTLWKQPYAVDIGAAVQRGGNTLEVEVVNTWLNRLVGDEQPGVTNRVTFTTSKLWNARTPLPPAGLIGPVTVRNGVRLDVK